MLASASAADRKFENDVMTNYLKARAFLSCDLVVCTYVCMIVIGVVSIKKIRRVKNVGSTILNW